MPILYSPLKINGVISTDKSVLQNLNDICTACGAFLTFDISQGKWAVVINTTGFSIKSYNNTNIIGPITVTETGVSELYNDVRMEFPHKTLRDQTDFVEVAIPAGDRFPNELDNQLQIQTNLINDPVQAQYIASVELKQSRLNKIINFTTDYTSLGLKAGDLIDVTSSIYGFTSKVFRVIQLEEVDDDVIGINITAMEYDANVYSTAGLVFKERTKKTGILLKQQNEVLKASDDADVSGSIVRMVAANIGFGLANSFLNKLFGRKQIGTDANGNPIFGKNTGPTDQEQQDLYKLLGGLKRPPLSAISAPQFVCEGASITITVGHSCQVCLFNMPDFDYPYTITGVSANDISIPLTGTITVSGSTGQGSITFDTIEDGASENGLAGETLTFTCGGQTASTVIYDVGDFTLSIASSTPSIVEGSSFTVTVTATGSKANASIPYTITGTALERVTSPALTGNITTSGGTGTLTVVTGANPGWIGTRGLTITVGSPGNPCVQGQVSTSVTILDNDAPPPPPPPPPPPDTSCQYIVVPAVWCGVFDGTDNQLKAMTVREYVSLPVPQAGEATITVPNAVSVSKGNPSTITVTSNVTVAAASVSVGGFPVRIITSFNSVAPNGIITGTTTTLYGY